MRIAHRRFSRIGGFTVAAARSSIAVSAITSVLSALLKKVLPAKIALTWHGAIVIADLAEGCEHSRRGRSPRLSRAPMAQAVHALFRGLKYCRINGMKRISHPSHTRAVLNRTGARAGTSPTRRGSADAPERSFNGISARSAVRCSIASICTSRSPRFRIRNCAGKRRGRVRQICARVWRRLARYRILAASITRKFRCQP